MLFFTTTVSVKRAALSTSAYGDRVRDWTDPQVVAADVPADVQFEGTTEVTDQRQQVTTLYRCLLPEGTQVASTDRVTWNGADYEVDGEPAAWESTIAGPTGHVRLVLKQVAA